MCGSGPNPRDFIRFLVGTQGVQGVVVRRVVLPVSHDSGYNEPGRLFWLQWWSAKCNGVPIRQLMGEERDLLGVLPWLHEGVSEGDWCAVGAHSVPCEGRGNTPMPHVSHGGAPPTANTATQCCVLIVLMRTTH